MKVKVIYEDNDVKIIEHQKGKVFANAFQAIKYLKEQNFAGRVNIEDDVLDARIIKKINANYPYCFSHLTSTF